jgi:hypothetical protein
MSGAESVEITGQCACGAIRFAIASQARRAYQCHCSTCRKITGSAFSTSIMVPLAQFSWLAGEEQGLLYARDNGYKSRFCRHCGSTVPNRFRDYPLYSVPLGALDDTPEVAIVAQLYLGSKAGWEGAALQGKRFAAMPTLDEMMALLQLS